jgi:nicotinamidase-related amidase
MFEIPSTALLVMDFQAGVVEGYSSDPEAVLAAEVALLDAARSAGLRIVYVVPSFRPGFPEISARNKPFGSRRASASPGDAAPVSVVHPAVAPQDGDIVVAKHRIGAFVGTDLDQVLRSNDVHTLVLTGVSTSGVVLSTALMAGDLDYRLLVVEDCCGEVDRELHRVLLAGPIGRQADVVRSPQVVEFLDSTGGSG